MSKIRARFRKLQCADEKSLSPPLYLLLVSYSLSATLQCSSVVTIHGYGTRVDRCVHVNVSSRRYGTQGGKERRRTGSRVGSQTENGWDTQGIA